MRRFINYIDKNVLVKVASLQTASVVTRIIAGILTSKAIAIFIGAEGLALIGNLRNFVSSVQTVSTLGFYNGAVKYIAEFKDNTIKLGKAISTIFYFGFIATILVSLTCYYNAETINNIIFPSYNNYAYIIKIFAMVLPFYALNMFSFSIMNGYSNYKMLIVINIIGQILGVSVTLLLIYQNKIEGALISVAIAESLVCLITLVGIINRRSLVPLIKVKEISFSFLKKLSPYSLMALFSAVILPLVVLAIRSYIIDTIGYKDAGFWEAVMRISKYYLMLMSSLMALYILPRFSEIDDVKEFRKEVFGFYKTVMPIFGIGLVLIYFLKGYIVTSIYFIDQYGVKGAVIGHFVSYLMYYILILLIFGTSLFKVDTVRKI